MYEVGDYIVHPGQGVCMIEAVTDGDQGSYQLLPVGQRNPMRISYPIAGADRLRPVIERDEAEAIIDGYGALAIDTGPCGTNALEEERYKDEIRSGSCLDTVRIVKTFRARIAAVRANNKKPPVVFERILKHASQRSLVELAVALDSTPDDVRALFEARSGEVFSEN